MTRPKIKISGNELHGKSGELIASINPALGEKTQSYVRLFAYSGALADLLEEVLNQQISNYERELNSSRAVPLSGVSSVGPDKLYTDLPDWVQTGLKLLAEINSNTSRT